MVDSAVGFGLMPMFLGLFMELHEVSFKCQTWWTL